MRKRARKGRQGMVIASSSIGLAFHPSNLTASGSQSFAGTRGGIPKGVALGAPLVTFPATGKSPGAWGGAPKRWEQEPAASCNFRVQGGAPAKGHAGTFVPAKALALDQNRLGDIRRGLGVPGVKICSDLFGVLLGQHRAAHHHLAGEVLSSQRGDGLLHAL